MRSGKWPFFGIIDLLTSLLIKWLGPVELSNDSCESRRGPDGAFRMAERAAAV